MKSAEVREKFLSFFESYHHQRVKSSSLVPAGDPTLLFTNAGMVQFKDCFLGLSDVGYKRATTSQKCVRAGGKHNDLENVGFTPRHHTFFEMLGNFSFGDYFKKEAIAYAWELLTRHYSLPKDRLRITVYKDDDEAFELWKAQGVRADWIVRLGEKDNFWAMGDTGPCGPCTEIHFDWGEQFGCGKPTCAPGCPCDKRFLEIWNLVFMQFNRDASGQMTPLPKPSVDTGAGLERLSCVLQGVFSNYDTDLFQPIIQAIAKQVGKDYGRKEESDVSMRVVADHLRSGCFLIADGVNPSNEGRGYVLRRILRRAIRHGKKLGQEKSFLYELVESVARLMGPHYPEVETNKKMISVVLKEEEERFHETLHRGMGLLEETVQKLEKAKQKVVSGEVAFKLYDSFGFPLDLIEILCKEKSLTLDLKRFDELMEKQRAQSSWKEGSDSDVREKIIKALGAGITPTKFVGYAQLRSKSSITHLFTDKGEATKTLSKGMQGFVIVDETPCYAESGGQVGDSGALVSQSASARIENTFKIAKVVVHRLRTESGSLSVGDRVELVVDPKLRQQAAVNHTATHMLHAALRKILGERVKQAGSLVEPDRLRFDFTFPRALSEDEITRVESLVNGEIFDGLDVNVEEMGFEQAMKTGALAFFDEKYGDRVRVVRIGSQEHHFSVELCGGTHIQRVSDIKLVKILSESSIASGVRRIEAITAERAIEHLQQRDNYLRHIETLLTAKEASAVKKVEATLQDIKSLQRVNEDLKTKLAQGGGGGTGLHDQAKKIGPYQVVFSEVAGVDPKILRTLVDQVRDKLKNKAVIVLATQMDGKVSLCIGITPDLTEKLDASKIAKTLAVEVGGTGGGKKDFAQAGGTNAQGLAGARVRLEGLLTEV